MPKLVKGTALKVVGESLAGSTPASPTIYGPYTRKDGRQHLCLRYPDGTKVTQSYPRFLVEQHLNRKLQDWEHVDHINNDKTDNRLENLQILSQSENNRKQTSLKPAKMHSFTCPVCFKESQKLLRNVKGNLKKGRSGPYCSRNCAGKASHQSPS